MKHFRSAVLPTLAGLALLALGLYGVKAGVLPGLPQPLPYVLVGLGCGLFGHGMGALVSQKALQHAPEARKALEIEQNDERNIMLESRAKAKAFDLMTFVFGALMVSLALMGTALSTVLLLVFAYLLVQGCAIYCRHRYEREL